MTTNEPIVSREHILALAKKCGMVWGYTTTELVDAVIGFAYVVLNDKAVQGDMLLPANAKVSGAGTASAGLPG